MVPPAQRNTVVGGRRAASRMLDHVVDLAPRRRHVTPGDQALAVTGDDRAPLMHREDPIGDRDADDAPLIEQHTLDRSRAAGLSRDTDRHRRLRPCDGRPPGSGRRVLRVDLHHERRCRTRHARHIVMTRGDTERRSQRVVTLLRGSAGIDHATRIGVPGIVFGAVSEIVGTAGVTEPHTGSGRPLGLGIALRIDDELQLRRRVGQQIPPQRVHPSRSRPIVRNRRC